MSKSFSFASLWVYVVVICWLSLATSLAFVEDGSIFKHVPVLGGYLFYVNSNWKFAMQIFCGFVVVCHIGETLYAGYLAMSSKMSFGDTIKWMLQTALLGVCSLTIQREKCKEMKKAS